MNNPEEIFTLVDDSSASCYLFIGSELQYEPRPKVELRDDHNAPTIWQCNLVGPLTISDKPYQVYELLPLANLLAQRRF